MAFKEFVEHAKQTNKIIEERMKNKGTAPQNVSHIPTNKTDDGQIIRPVQKSENKPENNFKRINPQVPERRVTQAKSPELGSIINNVIDKANYRTGQSTAWEKCKYLKKSDGQNYCTEFHCYCGKERCNRAIE